MVEKSYVPVLETIVANPEYKVTLNLPGFTLELLAGGHRLAEALFGLPFGKLDAGAPADLVVFDYCSPTPIESANLAGHLFFGLDRSHVASVMVEGRWIVRDRRLLTVDIDALMAHARVTATRVWGRMASL